MFDRVEYLKLEYLIDFNTCSLRQKLQSIRQQLQTRKLPAQPEMWFDFKTFKFRFEMLTLRTSQAA